MVNDGGPAFPLPITAVENTIYNSEDYRPLSRGMSLRDWMAGMALQAIVSKSAIVMAPVLDKEPVFMMSARGAYSYADAMLAAREVPHE